MKIWRWLFYGDDKGLERELEQEKVRTFNLTSQVVEKQAEVAALTKRIENCDRLAAEAEKDYNDMRAFQQKFITAEQQRKMLMEENSHLSSQLLKYQHGMKELRAWFNIGQEGVTNWFEQGLWVKQEPPDDER